MDVVEEIDDEEIEFQGGSLQNDSMSISDANGAI